VKQVQIFAKLGVLSFSMLYNGRFAAKIGKDFTPAIAFLWRCSDATDTSD
jgi:hypothetical protein